MEFVFTLCAVLSPGGRAAFNQCTKVLVSSAAFCWYVGVQDESPVTAYCAAPATTAWRVLCSIIHTTCFGGSRPSVAEINSGTGSLENTEKMTEGWEAGEPGQELLLVFSRSSPRVNPSALHPFQFLS